MALTKVVVRLKDKNIKLLKYLQTAPKEKQGKGNQSRPGNRNRKGKTKIKKDSKLNPQDKWKLETPKDGEAKTKNMNKKTYH